MDNNYHYEYTRENENSFIKIYAYYQALSIIENKVGNSLLDIGSNDGYITNILSKHFKKVVGLEPSKEQFEIARKKYPNIEFYDSFVEKFKYDGLFDTISVLLLYNCVKDRMTFLESIAKFLQKDGCIIIQVSNADAVNKKIAEIMGTLENRYEINPSSNGRVKLLYNTESLKKEIELTGMKVVKTGGIMYRPLTDIQMGWLLDHGLWDSGNGWGRMGEEKDWRNEFCRALYEYGKTCPEECAIIYAVVKKQ